MSRYSYLTLLLILSTKLFSNANNLTLSNVQFQDNDFQKKTISFNLSWENSWKDGINHDAVWVFMKFKKNMLWNHASIEEGSTLPSSISVIGTQDKKGIIISRNTTGEGTITIENITIDWLFDEDGIVEEDDISLQIFATEMVLISEGSLHLNTSPTANLMNEIVSVNGSITSITNENALPRASIRWKNDNEFGGTGNAYNDGTFDYYGSDTLGPDYPKGYAAFYVQKYETTQEQYVDFLNTLDRESQKNRVNKDISIAVISDTLIMTNFETARNRIWCSSAENNTTLPLTFYTDRPDRACNFLTWSHAAAYLDWSALRPMSELEYEKTCRGSEPVVQEEFAWGTTNIIEANSISGGENGTETMTESNANCNFNYIFNNISFTNGDENYGPLRVGIFADATSGREKSGASYYGVMEMSGNVWERCVTIAEKNDQNITTNAFQFSRFIHGDGVLDNQGRANVDFWPDDNGVGSNFKGGNWYRIWEYAMVSDRLYAGLTDNEVTSHRGIRGSRTPTWNINHGTGFSNTKYQGGNYDGYDTKKINNVVITNLISTPSIISLNVYPNPAKEQLTIYSSYNIEKMELTDINGKTIPIYPTINDSYTIQINTSYIPQGFYFLSIYGNDKIEIKKIGITKN